MSTISAGLSNTTALVQSGDTTGNLVFLTNGSATALTLDLNQNANFPGNVTVVGALVANIAGNGATLTNINASNITSGTISNAFTTAASANGASTIVARDSNGSFTANVITANGSALTAINASNVSSGTLDNARTSAASANGASTIVLRDSNGSFAGNVITGTTGSFTNISGNGVALTAINASNISSGTINNAYTTANSSNGASTIVARDSNGSFAANVGTFTSVSGNGVALADINASNISSGTISNAYTTAASANGASTIVARDSNGSFTANTVTLTAGTITTNAANATDITNKTYVDGLFSTGISYHDPVLVEEDVALNAVYVQPNGAGNGVGATLTNNGSNVALVVDGVSVSNTARILVYAQANAVQNGVYTVTNPGNASAQWVLTRATDADTFGLASPNKLGQGDAFFVSDGDTGAGRTYICNTPGTITFGTTNITFAQISSSQVYSAGTGLSLNNLAFSIANTAVTAATYGNAGAVATFTVNAQGQLTNAANTAINASSITLGTLSATYGGTGSANLTADNVILGNGASTVKVVAPGTANNVLTSNGSTWISQAPAAGGVSSITGTADQIIASSSTGAVTLSTPQSINTASSVQFGSFGVGTAASGTTGEIRATNNVTAFYSDERLKTKTGNIKNALDKVCQIETLLYHANETAVALGYDASIQEVGVTAQSVQKVQPEIVVSAPIDDKYLTVRYEKLVPLLIEAIKELKAEIDVLKAE
jgi:hypothetical protein